MDKCSVLLVICLCFINFLICNAYKIPNNVSIIGGHAISIKDVPFMASLRINGTFHYCGASIIHERFLVSAAHCIKQNRKYKILVGTDRLNQSGDLYDIEKIIVHENYNAKTMDYDICLIKLTEDLTFGPKVNKIDLADGNVTLKSGTSLNVTGWGTTSANSSAVSNDLLQVKVPLVPSGRCKKLYFYHLFKITPRMMCAGGKGKDSCQGDSGGPLTWYSVQVGVTSFGYQCGNTPGIYTKISYVLPWIINTMKANSKNTTKII